MKKQYKVMFKGAPRWLRRQLAALSKPASSGGFMMVRVVPRPEFIALSDGRRVAYEGP
jgi:hypothetical protein